eukprot:COSAG02_NODE_9351_length_2246_cov_184.727993_2_plen_373_part_00
MVGPPDDWYAALALTWPSFVGTVQFCNLAECPACFSVFDHRCPCAAGPSCWHGVAIDYSVVSYATTMSPDYDPAVDDPDPQSVQTRQVISSLLTMGLLLIYWLLTTAPLIFRCLRKSSNLAWMEANYEGPFVEYRLKKLSPEERSRAGLVGQYEATGDPTVSYDDEDEPVCDVEPPAISCCSRLLGSWRYEIETSEWNEADDTRSEKRTYRTLRKFVVEEETVLTAEMCHWDVMQIDRDTELQAAEIFRSLDLDGDGQLEREEMRTALAKLHGMPPNTPSKPLDQMDPLGRMALMRDQRAGGNLDEVMKDLVEGQLDEVMKDCDADGDGFIDALEFVSRSEKCACYLTCAAATRLGRFVRQRVISVLVVWCR